MVQLRLHISILLALTLGNIVCGQDLLSETRPVPKIELIGKMIGNSVYLRWGVDDKNAWKSGVEKGYIVERATIFRDGKPMIQPETKILNNGVITPKILESWEIIVTKNPMAGVVAQAIYGDSFITSNTNSNTVVQIVNQSSELQQRFGFSMFAIDQDFEVAEYAGLGFVDQDVRLGERYLYNIKLVEAEELGIAETGILINTTSRIDLPTPYDFIGYYYNDAFVLIWEYDGLRNFYNSYDLEKSEDGKNFSKVNKVPITKLSDTKVTGVSYTDSIPEYEKKYWYRIKGRSIFNEVSPPSEVVSLIAYKKLLVAPEWKSTNIISEKEAVLQWGFATDEAWKLKAFDILRADKAIGPYTTIEENLAPDINSISYNNLEDINYFKVRAKGIGGDIQDSSPTMVQPIDSIPPVAPIGLLGKIDTTGIVRLSWQQNQEQDLKGYAVFKANRANQEFTRLNKQELTGITYNDTVNLKGFNKKVYYKLVALDNRYNQSKFSKVLEMERPNIIPPTSPIFSDYQLKKDTVQLSWINSPSEDVRKTMLYRKQVSDESNNLWELIFETEEINTTVYNDITAQRDQKYLYSLTAVNDFGKEGEPSPPLSVVTQAILIREGVKGFFAEVDRENKFVQLNWRIGQDNIAEIQLYRKTNEGKFLLYKTLSATRKQFLDTRLVPNTTYVYGIKPVYQDGSVGKWEEKRVKY